MRLGLHFEIADTPPLESKKTSEKSEIYQDLATSEKLRIIRETEEYLPKVRMLVNNHQLNGRCVSLYILIFSIDS